MPGSAQRRLATSADRDRLYAQDVSRKSGRSGHRQGPRPRRPNATVTPLREHRETDPHLIRTLRAALRSDEPLDFLSVISGLVEVARPRTQSLLGRDEALPTLATLVDSFIDVPYAETTAALHVIRAFTTDEALVRTISTELGRRHHPLPTWLTGLEAARASDDVWFMTHVLGDGDDYFIGVELEGGRSVAALVYIDHNMGTVVKDAFVIPASLAEMIPTVRLAMDDPDQELTTVDAARARAQIEAAITLGSMIYPPFESDSWPMCRPLVDWMVRLLPAGGTVPERHEWTDDERDAIAEAFLDSPMGAGFRSDDHRYLLDNILWFATDYGPGDPYRWSPVNVEIVLTDWFPRKIVARPAELAPLPDLLRAFVRYCHDLRGIRSTHTDDTLDSIDLWEPEYQRIIRSARPQGAAGLLAGMISGRLDGVDDLDDDLVLPTLMLESLDRAVGGRMQLMALDAEPLPDEEFEWAGVPEDIRPAVEAIIVECDRVADALLDVEHRTAMRRLLSRAAVGDPAVFRRKAGSNRGAAAIAWIITSASNTTQRYLYGETVTAKDLLAAFGVSGSVSDRASTLLRAIGVDSYARFRSLELAAPDLLTSQRRAQIIDRRDRYLAQLRET